ncbi:hypothetical protein HELRODRAFT_188404 [Helobdella robusta]|uniref:Uncharacterized protein n=1 Tax=Helobdella robusta TaxID=6412 RepID=T1FPY6_HELRO|nr:hypothetical protein HELRODRAFT_188404 [Helobdella robusta]ESO06586.1 hypothetical protein HELRODRAFT_188404 [Helobdella robusta]
MMRKYMAHHHSNVFTLRYNKHKIIFYILIVNFIFDFKAATSEKTSNGPAGKACSPMRGNNCHITSNKFLVGPRQEDSTLLERNFQVGGDDETGEVNLSNKIDGNDGETFVSLYDSLVRRSDFPLGVISRNNRTISGNSFNADANEFGLLSSNKISAAKNVNLISSNYQRPQKHFYHEDKQKPSMQTIPNYLFITTSRSKRSKNSFQIKPRTQRNEISKRKWNAKPRIWGKRSPNYQKFVEDPLQTNIDEDVSNIQPVSGNQEDNFVEMNKYFEKRNWGKKARIWGKRSLSELKDDDEDEYDALKIANAR